ncbi:MAG TPA: hypothetical protein PLF79_08685 [Thauera sp.]|uniref:phage major capsid protein n=1 Tax=Thauera sp. TaxID=1905334 RepID=UPI002BEE064E|nr:hypothetical protein [Thauera sp.]HRP23621.1 hypothetical protein [Thauera sp.]HRP66134.1 hypothetical protein [Thauera sp.]
MTTYIERMMASPQGGIPRPSAAAPHAHHPADLLAAGADALAAAFGIETRTPHPLAADLDTAPLSRLAYAAGLAIRPQQSYENDRAVMARGMQSADYAGLLAAASMTLVNRRFDAAAEHLAFCAVIECRDFKPLETAATGVDLELPEVRELGEPISGYVAFGAGNTAQLKTYSRILRIARNLIINDQAGMIADTVAQLGAAAARTEARELYAVLESNPTMDDGELVFHADHGNIVASALDVTSLGTAMAALRTMTLTGGNAADLPAAHLVVAADLELAARKLVHEAGLQITVTASSRLPSGRWYLLPSPEVAPAVGVLRLRARTTRPAMVEAWRGEAFDGVLLKPRVDTGAVLVARTLIRGGA